MYDRIIVPVEEGATAESLAAARSLARSLDCALTLLHVHRPHEVPASLEGLPQYRYQHVVDVWGARDLDAEGEEAEWLAALVERVAALEPDMPVDGHVVHAPLSRCVGSDCERLLALSVTAGVDRADLDATAQELIRTCEVPVLLVRPDMPARPIRRILVALDGSRFSEEAVAPAMDLARSAGARLTLLEVVNHYNGLVRLLHPAARSTEAAEGFLRNVASRLPSDLGPVESMVVEHASAAGGIIDEARAGGVDVIAMATHGRGGLLRFMLGSVAETVILDSPVPVLVYRPRGIGAQAPDRSEALGSSI